MALSLQLFSSMVETNYGWGDTGLTFLCCLRVGSSSCWQVHKMLQKWYSHRNITFRDCKWVKARLVDNVDAFKYRLLEHHFIMAKIASVHLFLMLANHILATPSLVYISRMSFCMVILCKKYTYSNLQIFILNRKVCKLKNSLYGLGNPLMAFFSIFNFALLQFEMIKVTLIT